MTEAKVILVNDEKSQLSPLQQSLKKGGLTVTSCAAAFDALDRLAAEGADLVIASTKLPDMDGYQLSCLIKSNERTEGLPVVLVKTGDGGETFWAAAAMADREMDLKEAKSADKLQKLVADLVARSREQGWKTSMAKESGVAPGSFTSADTAKSFRLLLGNLLIERLMGRVARSLMDATSPRKKFLDTYFAVISRLFNCQAAGLVVAGTAAPWASFHLSETINKMSFDELVKKLSRETGGSKELSLDIRGALEEQGGAAISTPEILTVKAANVTLGALVFSSTQKQGFDMAARAAMAELQVQMAPVLRLLQASQQIEELHQQSDFRAATDALTGLYNLEFLVGFLQQQLLFSYRQRSPVGLVIIDIDHLQAINDEYGFEIGDLVLSTIGNRLLNLTRSSDLLARYGGDEFAVVLPNTDANGARILAEKIRLEVEQMSFVKGPGRKGPRVTVSIGCAGFNMEDLNPETILRDAKLALKRAKEGGRNQVSL